MKIRFVKDFSGSYGVFPKGRECDLPPNMLASIPKDSYEEVKPADAEITETGTGEKEGAKSNGKSKTDSTTKAGAGLPAGPHSKRKPGFQQPGPGPAGKPDTSGPQSKAGKADTVPAKTG